MRNYDTLTTAQAAEQLGRDPRHVLRLVARGVLEPKAKLPGKTGAYLFEPADVAALVGGQPDAPAGPPVSRPADEPTSTPSPDRLAS